MKSRIKKTKEYEPTKHEKRVLQFIGVKVFKEMRWLNLLIAELMHVEKEDERELLEELIAKSRKGIRKLEDAGEIILKKGITNEVKGMVSSELLKEEPKKGRRRS